ncbi:hypothetical protein [Dechloromonas sp. TW-R-39-2]|uniref:hypothetical protein n=1 Tax=Dechloromonas sp. TW-R-39-2 TaxID=2654218 RepID=UPI00193E3C99|nr:hypothetical protein [Dechloromonas sp. TW-R-39-2]
MFEFRFFGWKYNKDNDYLDENGNLVVSGSKKFANGHLATATLDQNDHDSYVGTVFKGGAYFEIEFKFDPSTVNTKNGWPSFWAIPIVNNGKKFAGLTWPGAADKYANTVEIDIFEYNQSNKFYYGGGFHNWYGVYNETCVPNFCRYSIPTRDSKRFPGLFFDFSKFHRYGLLWVPATSSRQGSATFFVDSHKVGMGVTWDYRVDDDFDLKKWEKGFSSIDREKYMLIVGTGYEQPLTIRSLKVWQKNMDGKEQIKSDLIENKNLVCF